MSGWLAALRCWCLGLGLRHNAEGQQTLPGHAAHPGTVPAVQKVGTFRSDRCPFRSGASGAFSEEHRHSTAQAEEAAGAAASTTSASGGRNSTRSSWRRRMRFFLAGETQTEPVPHRQRPR
jgi:hypothetical protein